MTPPDNQTLVCPACGTSIRGRKSACPRCGRKFDRNAKFECPFCGELILEGSKKCPVCKVDLSGVSDKAKSQSVEKTLGQLMTDLAEIESTRLREEAKRFRCPTCARLLVGTESRCPNCGQILTGELGLRCPICGTTVKKGLRECPKCGIALDKISELAKPMIPLGPESAVEHGARKFVEVPKEPIKAEEATQKPARERKLRPARVTTVPVAAQTSARGLSNGVGQVNGLSKVNGTGAVNGRAFVNGTGISNGLGARSKESSGKDRSFLTRWQFIAVLVAIVIVIPTFVFLSYSNRSEKFSIDGKFGEWEGATAYGTRIPSTASSCNVTEWAVATQSSDLFLYFRTQAHMMSSPDAESYYLFVDSDGSNATGYIMESIGADYMLKLTGWNSAVNSTSLSRYSSSSDQYNWNAWTSIGSLSYSLDLVRLEASATMPVALEQSAKFVLISKDSADRGSVSYTAPLKGGMLIVRQAPSAAVTADGILPRSSSVAALTVWLKCEGEGGHVDLINPVLTGAPLAGQIGAFSLDKGEEREILISLDTSSALDGQVVSAKILESGIVSSFASVDIIGDGASAYVVSSPPSIAIDGAFADWVGRLSVDQDPIPVAGPGTDIDEVGNVTTSYNSYFYVSVEGEMCSGTFVPAMVTKPSGAGGGGGAVIPTRHTAEDILRIYVDSDKSNSTGEVVSLNSKEIGADQKIEIKGLFGRITSMKEFNHSSWSGNWEESAEPVDAAKDTKRIEISVSATSLGGSSDIDFIVETTSWKGRSDLATFDPSSMRAFTRTWIVDSATTSPYATSMSYQRKMFYDGINYWSLFFDGANTVHKYSVDEGQTWTYSGPVFTTPGVNETSIWYDSSASTVYVVGDTSSATNNISIQVGVVDAAAHTISWAASDSSLNTSSFALAGKNTYISKDLNGSLWVLSSNSTAALPGAYQLSAFKSSEVNSTTSWVFSGQMLAATAVADNVKGSIVPAGYGSDVWAVYASAGSVAARKYNGTWQAPQTVYMQGPNKANTDNSPPSVVVDGNGVVHVVYGTGRKSGPNSIPWIEYSRNDTDLTTFTSGVNLDPFIASSVGDYYPTITLENSTGDLYVLWLQSNDATYAPKTVMGRKCVSGEWSNMTIEPQTSFTKQYLTSIYSVSGEFKICWQWTQNTTAPTEVMFDRTEIPEFGDIALPILGIPIAVAISRLGRRAKDESR